MPYQITPEAHFLRVTLSGDVTLEDLRQALAALQAIDTTAAIAVHRMTDLRAVTSSELKATNIAAAAEARRSLKYPNPFRSAIVAPDPARYGYARMFQTMNNHPDITVAIFTDEAEAIKWLREAPAPAAPE